VVCLCHTTGQPGFFKGTILSGAGGIATAMRLRAVRSLGTPSPPGVEPCEPAIPISLGSLRSLYWPRTPTLSAAYAVVTLLARFR
jgi:hypothetical protein